MTTSTINGDDEGRKDQEAGGSTTPTTGFTAVNGKASPPAQAKSKSDQEPKKTPPEAASHRQLLPNTNEPPGPFQRDSRPSTTGHERRISPAPPSNPEARPTTNGHSQYGEGHSNGTSQPAPHAVMSPPMPRRKRSLSQERGPIYPGNGPPPSPGGHRMSIDNGSSRERDPYGHRHDYTPPHENYPPHEGYPPQHSYPPPPQDHPGPSPHDIYPRGDRHQMTRSEYDHPVDPSIVPGGPRPYYPDAHDAHLADALQRENRGYDGGPGSRSYHSPEDDDDQNGQYEDYGAGRDSNSMDPDRRKRKRVFSNRTKTGCMTCRRRKKKCDEMHPECQNCLRGGFVCEGYNARNTWQKPTNTKQPIPLQSKNGYPVHPGPPNRAPYQPAPRYDASPDYSGPPPHHRQSYDGGRPGPGPEDDRDHLYGRPDLQPKPQPAWNKAARPYPSNPPQASKYEGGHEHRGSIYEMPPDSTDPHGMHAPPPDSRRESTVSQYTSTHNGTPAPHTNVQAAAQAALTHPAALRPAAVPRRTDNMTEREKMLKGQYYYPNTPVLVADRENCIAAVWRFNNATNPSHGASPEERVRLFRQILTLRPNPEPPQSSIEPALGNTPLPFGSVGEGVIVEAPFHCDYGYNITVGDNVYIGADCRISDTCSVTIGARCIFSPNVKLICATYPIDPRKRSGSNGPALGRNIVIEEDCWIGANVTILAGVRVGRSSTVGAGSLLHMDVPRFTVVAGNPAKVSRGIYDGSQDT